MRFSGRAESEFYPKLAGRAQSFRVLFRELNRETPLILETGCLRKQDNWDGDGQSTLMFDAFAEEHHGAVWSVDISPESVIAARRACGPSTHLILGDSVRALHSLVSMKPERKADLLYLDSMDLDVRNPRPSAEHHLSELAAALPLLRSGSLVCVDDYGIADGGKGALVNEYMTGIDAPVLYEGYQKLWRMP